MEDKDVNNKFEKTLKSSEKPTGKPVAGKADTGKPAINPATGKSASKPLNGKSATGLPLDTIDFNPQLNDVSTNGNLLKMRKEDSAVDAPLIQERVALTLSQRQKRSRALRSHAHSMQHARDIAQKKLASTPQLEKRAIAHARSIVKKRFAARRGTPYAELSTSEKIQVDNAVSKKTKLIKKIAFRLLPRIRKSEFERLKSFRAGEALKDLSTPNPAGQGIMPKMNEEITQLFDSLNRYDTPALIDIIKNTINEFNNDNNPMGEELTRILMSVLPDGDAVITETLLKKSNKTGIVFSTLKEVFIRGEFDWDPSQISTMNQEQYAFARVNSYIAKGKAWHMDADLRENNTELDAVFSDVVAKKPKKAKGTEVRTAIHVLSRGKSNPANAISNPRVQAFQKIDESEGKPSWPRAPYVKPYLHPQTKEHIGWVAATKWGKKQYFGPEFKKSATKHAGLDELFAAYNEDNTHPIVKEYNALKKHDIKTLRGMIAQSSRIIDASDFKTKDHAVSHLIRQKHGNTKVNKAFGFNEDVVAGDKQPVYMPAKRHADGTWGQAKTVMKKVGKKILDIEEPASVDSDTHDGK